MMVITLAITTVKSYNRSYNHFNFLPLFSTFTFSKISINSHTDLYRNMQKKLRIWNIDITDKESSESLLSQFSSIELCRIICSKINYFYAYRWSGNSSFAVILLLNMKQKSTDIVVLLPKFQVAYWIQSNIYIDSSLLWILLLMCKLSGRPKIKIIGYA